MLRSTSYVAGPVTAGPCLIHVLHQTSRDPDRGKEALAEIEMDTGRSARLIQMDLADLDSVQNAAEEFLRHVLTSQVFDWMLIHVIQARESIKRPV
jgi:hypothetical protein